MSALRALHRCTMWWALGLAGPTCQAEVVELSLPWFLPSTPAPPTNTPLLLPLCLVFGHWYELHHGPAAACAHCPAASRFAPSPCPSVTLVPPPRNAVLHCLHSPVTQHLGSQLGWRVGARVSHTDFEARCIGQKGGMQANSSHAIGGLALSRCRCCCRCRRRCRCCRRRCAAAAPPCAAAPCCPSCACGSSPSSASCCRATIGGR